MCQHLGSAEERRRRGKSAWEGEQRGGKDWDVLRNSSAPCGTEDGEVSQDCSRGTSNARLKSLGFILRELGSHAKVLRRSHMTS